METAADRAVYILYGTSACHLCELAEQLLLLHSRDEAAMVFEKVDISGSDVLFERYGVRIPVLRDDANDRELDWPFNASQLREFAGR
ncbi:MAG: glutaredoxin family protein [Halieaceae bacterium]|nr:glutaredoxin family protein [Halieaceae bacterium]